MLLSTQAYRVNVFAIIIHCQFHIGIKPHPSIIINYFQKMSIGFLH